MLLIYIIYSPHLLQYKSTPHFQKQLYNNNTSFVCKNNTINDMAKTKVATGQRVSVMI